MAVAASVVSVGTTATKLTSPASDYPGKSIALQPAAAIFIGPANVTTATGFPVASGATVSVDLTSSEDVYAVVASGTVNVNVFQTGV